jgi:hypothetical protein
LKNIPSSKNALTNFRDKPTATQIVAWLHTQIQPASPKAKVPSADLATLENEWNSDDPLNEVADMLVERAMKSPWTSQQVPPLAKWVAENQKPLEQMVEASVRPRCYFPSPTYLNNKQETLIETLLPGAQGVRMAGRSLGVRAMWHLGEGRHAEAWRDLVAAHRIGHLTAQGQTLVEQLVGMAISNIVSDGTVALLDQKSLSVEQARQIQADLLALEYFHTVADSLNSMERLSYIDAIIELGVRKNASWLSDTGMKGQASQLDIMNHVRVNWNVALQKGNEFYDRLVAAARLPDRRARVQAISQIDGELNRMATDVRRPGTLVGGLINPSSRSDIAASVMLALFLPAVTAAIDAEDSANTILDLERLAAALAVYRAEHGNFPEKLENLTPGVIATLPRDLYSNKPFIYKRTPDGYLLYSPGDNGNDDGGSNETQQVFEGQSTSDLELDAGEKLREKIPHRADDWSIRLPRLQFKMPAIQPGAASGESK